MIVQKAPVKTEEFVKTSWMHFDATVYQDGRELCVNNVCSLVISHHVITMLLA